MKNIFPLGGARLAAVLWLLAASAVAQSSAAIPSSAAGQAGSNQPTKEQKMEFKNVTPNLMCTDLERSLRFYRDVLGFAVSQTVPPEKAPFIFAWMKRGDVSIFLNQHMPPQAGRPDLYAGQAIGGTNSMYIVLTGIDELAKSVEQGGVKFAVPMHTEFYGMREFAVKDPDGYVLIF